MNKKEDRLLSMIELEKGMDQFKRYINGEFDSRQFYRNKPDWEFHRRPGYEVEKKDEPDWEFHRRPGFVFERGPAKKSEKKDGEV
ncbi:hypothetical protein [Dictyobacter formicarum]|uniref:Uncharacterized protein n=1 Tax=Dictyobacter formicarum TaxID=2778368 RepID=A0ABQ3VHS8_9CHLR|nr:hypothetical protein [Dictyobacter formicarum]GHO85236.1 hypothetical protein KSZ_32420 [Dictyobacter formicarum]